MIREGDTAGLRKERGAFFTPPPIAEYLAKWAVSDDPGSRVLDPTCGEAAFILAAGRLLKGLGKDTGELDQQLFGVDLHGTSLACASNLLEEDALDAHLVKADFFDLATPDQLGAQLPYMDAVIGNPPYIRYQHHVGDARARSRQAALRQGVRLSGLASSWAALIVHACGFLKPEGRLAMVLPAELLTVGYAEPVRAWLRDRFEQVHLVLFERLQFHDAIEKVVLVLAKGSGGCDGFSLYYFEDAYDLQHARPMDNIVGVPAQSGKWTDMLLSNRQRQLFRHVTGKHFTGLGTYGSPELGTVTGANNYFTLTEKTRLAYGLLEGQHVVRVCPPGTKHLRGMTFSSSDWVSLRDAGERVWLLHPSCDDETPALRAYVRYGQDQRFDQAYKCTIRNPWWRPPVVRPPDLFFTYMSHRYPRLIANTARVTFVNSMHGMRLKADAPKACRPALPLLAFNSLTMLGAELYGRSYGGGVLKMEPREAALLPVPKPEALENAWSLLRADRDSLNNSLRQGRWTNVVKLVDDTLLIKTLGMSVEEVAELRHAARSLRSRRIGSECEPSA